MATNGSNQPSQQQQPAQQPPQSANQPNASANIIAALTSAFKSQTGEPFQNDRIATLLLQNMPQLTELAKQGKLNQNQIMQVRLLYCCLIVIVNDVDLYFEQWDTLLATPEHLAARS